VAPLRPIFKTVALSGADVGMVAAFSALPLVLGEGFKLFRSATGRPAVV
jgi:hypothetical protein